MKIFVTGGTGFIGSYVLSALKKAGYNDIIASKRSGSRMDLVKHIDGITWKECDLLDVMEMEEILSSCDTCIHIAGMVSMSPWKKDILFKTNIDITANLINLSLATGVKRFIHYSSVAALGFSSKEIDETAVWTENDSKKYYSLSKYLGEREAWRGFAEGLNVSIINPSFVMGGSYWNYGPMNIFSRIEKGLKYYPVGSNGCVDVRDVADMSIRLLERDDLKGRRFICSGHNISHFDLMSKICKALDRNPPSTPINGILGSLAWRTTSTVARLKGKEALFTKESYDISRGAHSYDNTQSIQLLEMNYRPLDETIDDTVKCYKETKSGRFGILD